MSAVEVPEQIRESVQDAYHEPDARTTAQVQEAIAAIETATNSSFDPVPEVYEHDRAMLASVIGRSLTGMYVDAWDTVSIAPDTDDGGRALYHELVHALQYQHVPDADVPAFQAEGFSHWLTAHCLDEAAYSHDPDTIGMDYLPPLDELPEETIEAILPAYIGTVFYDAIEAAYGRETAVRVGLSPLPYAAADALLDEALDAIEATPDQPDVVTRYFDAITSA